jgi:very-short-patch-repair endonuclease
LNNQIRIVENQESCLVYDQQITDNGLLWKDLANWWADSKDILRSKSTDNELFSRLKLSLDSEPEKGLFSHYYHQYSKRFGDALPVLIPQVYLHYDPYSIKKYGIQYLLRQRMDFLILFSNSRRVVIEVDGKQHYSEGNTSSPSKYSEMVRLDRELKMLNYDVYRFGGYELTYDLTATLNNFFDKLFDQFMR